MILGTGKVNSYNLIIADVKVSCSKEVKLLGITIYNQLKFKIYVEDLCKETSYKLHVLRRLRPYLASDKARPLANSFIGSQLKYAPLIWMFAGKRAINKIYKIYYRTHPGVYNNFIDSHDAVLSVNNDISICQKHLLYLAVKIYKIVVEFNPEFM